MVSALALRSCFSLLLAVAAASQNCRSDVCKGDEVSLLQTVSNVKKSVESDALAEAASVVGYVSTGGEDEVGNIKSIIKNIKKEEKKWEANIRLKVKLASGSNLEDRDWGWGKSDAYCKIKLVVCSSCSGNKDATEKTSPVVYGSSNPVWNFAWETVDWDKGDQLEFDCYDEDIGSTDDHLGKGILELTRNQDFSGDVALDRKGHLRVTAEWQDCKGDCETMTVSMAKMADKVYSFDKQAGNFHMVRSLDIAAADAALMGKDHMALFKKRGSKECALAFSGSNDATDWVNNFNVLSDAGLCGYESIHRGIAKEARNYVKSGEMATFSKIISKLCGGEVSVTGHSLGGGVATVVAGCASSSGGLSAIGSAHKDMKPFKVKGLYTVGAPGVSRPAVTDTGGKCFPGKRAFNEDSRTIDIVPWIAQKFGYLQPHIEAVELTSSDSSVLSKTDFSCSSKEASHRPWKEGAMVPPGLPSLTDHKTSTYVHRLKELFIE